MFNKSMKIQTEIAVHFEVRVSRVRVRVIRARVYSVSKITARC